MEVEFGDALLRLKEQLRLHNDKDVALALGMTPTGFNSRKVRGSFPGDRVYALAAKRPDLRIDPDYVLTGQRGAVVVEAKPAPNAPINYEQLGACMRALTDRALQRGIALDARSVGALAGGLYEYARKGNAVDAAAVDLALDSFTQARGDKP